jgi:glycosyltransferase involved in cell wall biosynthesis
MKLITFAVPCYNSAAYMEHCVDTLLQGGENIEIILVDDGSVDETGAIADRYAEAHPDIVRVIHQPNGGHGEGVNQGIRNASGMYYKVVDSDDWLDVDALKRVLDRLAQLAERAEPLDMMICNYVYEHAEDGTSKAINYKHVFPEEQIFTWKEVGHWKPSEYLLMHSVIYRTQMLRECGVELPKHTFYVDNLYVYQPLPYVRSMYYMNEDLYRYFIGREDQSVNEQVMVKRVDQQVRVTELMLNTYSFEKIKDFEPKLGTYMLRYLSMMMMISSIFLIISDTDEHLAEKERLWKDLKDRDPEMYNKLHYRSLAVLSVLPGRGGRHVSKRLYQMARKIYKFN